MSMYREPNDLEPLSFDEVILIGEKQKFRVGFMLIRYTSSIFAIYISRTMDANRVCVLAEPDLSVEMLVYYIHSHLIDRDYFRVKYSKDPGILWSLARIASQFEINDLSLFIEFLLLEVLIGNNKGISCNVLYSNVENYLSDFYLANTFEFKNLARQMFPCVLHCIAQDRRIIQTNTMLRNYSADPKFEEFFRLLRHDSCFYFTTLLWNLIPITIMNSMMSIILVMPISSDTDEY